MTNEEKILQKLDQLTASVQAVEQRQASSPTLEQIQAMIPTVEQIREVVKEEVRSEVTSQLESKLTQKLAPIHEKLDEIRGDGDSYARTDAYHDRRLKRLEKQLGLHPLPTQ